MKVKVKVPEKYLKRGTDNAIKAEINPGMEREVTTPKYAYYNRRFNGMSDKAIGALKECYRTRKKNLHEQDTKNYATFLKETDSEFAEEGLKGFRDMAVFYVTYTKGKSEASGMIKKDWPQDHADNEIRSFCRGIN